MPATTRKRKREDTSLPPAASKSVGNKPVARAKLQRKADPENKSKPEETSETSVSLPIKESESAVEAGEVHVRAIRKHPMLNLCVFLLGVVFLMAGCVGGVFLYKHSTHRTYYTGICGVRYYDGITGHTNTNSMFYRKNGEFEQQVDISSFYEKFKVPSLGEASMATILHDFNANLTAIVDDEQEHCFLLPLNRSLVLPPNDLWDLFEKLRNGYYLPDAEIVEKNFRAVFPPIRDLRPYGTFFWSACHSYYTYLLVPEDQPYAMSKRMACDVAGKKYCLGGAGKEKMMCIKIDRCI